MAARGVPLLIRGEPRRGRRGGAAAGFIDHLKRSQWMKSGTRSAEAAACRKYGALKCRPTIRHDHIRLRRRAARVGKTRRMCDNADGTQRLGATCPISRRSAAEDWRWPLVTRPAPLPPQTSKVGRPRDEFAVFLLHTCRDCVDACEQAWCVALTVCTRRGGGVRHCGCNLALKPVADE